MQAAEKAAAALRGTPYDRGSSDGFYKRASRPHKWLDGKHTFEVQDLTKEEVAEYRRGYKDAGAKRVADKAVEIAAAVEAAAALEAEAVAAETAASEAAAEVVATKAAAIKAASAAAAAAAAPRMTSCKVCRITKGNGQFSKAQLKKPTADRKCRECADIDRAAAQVAASGLNIAHTTGGQSTAPPHSASGHAISNTNANPDCLHNSSDDAYASEDADEEERSDVDDDSEYYPESSSGDGDVGGRGLEPNSQQPNLNAFFIDQFSKQNPQPNYVTFERDAADGTYNNQLSDIDGMPPLWPRVSTHLYIYTHAHTGRNFKHRQTKQSTC